MHLIGWENGASFQDQSQSVVILKWHSGLRSTIFNGSTVQMSVESNWDCFGLSLLRDWLRELVRFLLDHSHSKLKPMSTHRLLEVFTLVLIGCERARKRALFFNQSDSNQNQLAFSRALNCWLVFTLNFHWLVLIKIARSLCSIACHIPMTVNGFNLCSHRLLVVSSFSSHWQL